MDSVKIKLDRQQFIIHVVLLIVWIALALSDPSGSLGTGSIAGALLALCILASLIRNRYAKGERAYRNLSILYWSTLSCAGGFLVFSFIGHFR